MNSTGHHNKQNSTALVHQSAEQHYYDSSASWDVATATRTKTHIVDKFTDSVNIVKTT